MYYSFFQSAHHGASDNKKQYRVINKKMVTCFGGEIGRYIKYDMTDEN